MLGHFYTMLWVKEEINDEVVLPAKLLARLLSQ